MQRIVYFKVVLVIGALIISCQKYPTNKYVTMRYGRVCLNSIRGLPCEVATIGDRLLVKKTYLDRILVESWNGSTGWISKDDVIPLSGNDEYSAWVQLALQKCSSPQYQSNDSTIVLDYPRIVFKKIIDTISNIYTRSFYVSETEITNEAFYEYLSCNKIKRDDEVFYKEWVKKTKPLLRTDGPQMIWTNDSLLWHHNRYSEDHEKYPVTFLTISDAVSFCDWLSLCYPELGEFRLPTKSEWLWAAYGSGRSYPWGMAFDSSKFLASINADNRTHLEPVLTHQNGRTPDGLFGMWGNAAEYVIDDSLLTNEFSRHPFWKYAYSDIQWMGGPAPINGKWIMKQDFWGFSHGPRFWSDAVGFRIILVLRNQ